MNSKHNMRVCLPEGASSVQYSEISHTLMYPCVSPVTKNNPSSLAHMASIDSPATRYSLIFQDFLFSMILLV